MYIREVLIDIWLIYYYSRFSFCTSFYSILNVAQFLNSSSEFQINRNFFVFIVLLYINSLRCLTSPLCFSLHIAPWDRLRLTSGGFFVPWRFSRLRRWTCGRGIMERKKREGERGKSQEPGRARGRKESGSCWCILKRLYRRQAASV